jgi:SAM-dependent methyltransferase
VSVAVDGQAVVHCWCGNLALLPYCDDYQFCPNCGTLVTRALLANDLTHVHDEASDFYGANYFFERAREHQFPDLTERARLDLSERCVYWLKALLAHRAPPARTLELGSSSGAFVALLASAGFDATGQDLSPTVTAFAKDTFAVKMLTGPLEEQTLAEQSQDALILMDVLEHLRDPVGTLSAGVRALREDGLLLIQMPCFDPALSYADLKSAKHPFLALLQPQEHIYLYSRASATVLLRKLGFEHIEFLPAFFDMYDMFLLASRRPITQVSEPVWRQALRRSREGRIVEALIDAFDGARARIALQQRLDQVEVDRARRLEVILAQQQQLARLRQQGSAWRRARTRLGRWLAHCKTFVRGRP